jgi:hypothetical protein
LPTAPISPAVTMPWPLPSIGLSLLPTKFQPIRSSGVEVLPSCVEPLAQPLALVGAITSAAVITPPSPSTSLPGPWLIGLFRSVNVMTPSS